MSFQEDLSRKRDTPIAIFHRFRTGFSQNNVLHLFVEGYEDAFFYEKHIIQDSKNNADKWKTYICLGKKNMDGVFKLFSSSTFVGKKVLFIRDSDFDFFLNRLPEGDNIVATRGYSVENYVCDPSVVKSYIIAGLGVDRDEANVDALITEHQQAISKTFVFLEKFIGASLLALKHDCILDLDKLNIKYWYEHFYLGTAAIEGALY